MKTHHITIDKNGGLRFIYADELRFLLTNGKAEIKRASMVEPTGTGWTVDLTPVGGPAPGRIYRHRSAALKAEEKWIKQNHL